MAKHGLSLKYSTVGAIVKAGRTIFHDKRMKEESKRSLSKNEMRLTGKGYFSSVFRDITREQYAIIREELEYSKKEKEREIDLYIAIPININNI